MLTFNTQEKIASIEEGFHTNFPFLKLELFTKSYSAYAKKDTVLSHISPIYIKSFKEKEKTELIIYELMSVLMLENLFLEKMNLSALVFRKSGQSWIEITMTDDWTLKRQNDEGRELSALKRDR